MRYSVSRGYRVVGIVGGVPALAGSVVLFLEAQQAELGTAGAGSMYVWATLLLLLALGCLYVAATVHAHDVEISETGLCQIASGRMTLWSSVAALRERYLLQRVDLVGHQGERLASLEFQLDGFEAALLQVVDACAAVLPRPLPATFRPAASDVWRLVAAGLAALALGCAAASLVLGPGVFLVPMVVVPTVFVGWRILRNQTVLAVAVSPSSVRVTTGRFIAETPLHEVEDVVLGLRNFGNGMQSLSVSLVPRVGEPLEIRPFFADACSLFATVRAAWLGARPETPLPEE